MPPRQEAACSGREKESATTTAEKAPAVAERPTVEIQVGREPATSRDAGDRHRIAAILGQGSATPPPNALTSTVFALQRAAGNAAVAQLLERRAGAAHVQRERTSVAVGGSKDDKAEARGRPDWSKFSSDQGALPGEYVQGVPSSEDGRRQLEGMLLKRHDENVSRIEAVQDVVPEGVTDVWTAYATERMRDAAEEGRWPAWGDVLAGVAQAALMKLFPAARLVKMIGQIRTDIAQGAVAAPLAILFAYGENEGQRKKLKERSEELRKQAPSVAKMISSAMKPLIRTLGDDIYYLEWLQKAPATELHLFRLPALVPEVAVDDVKTTAAQSLVGQIQGGKPLTLTPARNPLDNSREVTYEGQSNVIEMRLQATAFGKVKAEKRPTLRAATALREHIVDKPIAGFPAIPLMIQLYGQPDLVERSVMKTGPDDRNPASAAAVTSAYPLSSPLYIERRADGTIGWLGGGLADHLHVYERLHRDLNVSEFLVPYLKTLDREDEPLSRPDRVTPADVAKDIYQRISPDLEEAAQLFIDESVDPLKVASK